MKEYIDKQELIEKMEEVFRIFNTKAYRDPHYLDVLLSINAMNCYSGTVFRTYNHITLKDTILTLQEMANELICESVDNGIKSRDEAENIELRYKVLQSVVWNLREAESMQPLSDAELFCKRYAKADEENVKLLNEAKGLNNDRDKQNSG